MQDNLPEMEAVERVAKVLRDRGSSRAWLALRCNISRNYVYQIFAGSKPLTDRVANDFARVLGIPREVLFFGLDLQRRKGRPPLCKDESRELVEVA